MNTTTTTIITTNADPSQAMAAPSRKRLHSQRASQAAASATASNKNLYQHCTAQACARCEGQRKRSDKFKCSGPRQRCGLSDGSCHLCETNPGKSIWYPIGAWSGTPFVHRYPICASVPHRCMTWYPIGAWSGTPFVHRYPIGA